MKILAIETSSTACSVALLLDDEVIALHKIIPLQQAQNLLPMLEELLKSNNVSLNQIDAVAFGCGPGSFTGVRIATSTAKALGYALNLPVIPISSLAALAQATYQAIGWKKLLAGVDARIQEVYWGCYEINSEGLATLVDAEQVCKPEEVVTPKQNDWCGVGSAWQIYLNQIAYKPLNLDASQLPTASAVAVLAKAKYRKQEWVSASVALPVYLRDEVAKKSKK